VVEVQVVLDHLVLQTLAVAVVVALLVTQAAQASL
jgi:hypothetical protein